MRDRRTLWRAVRWSALAATACGGLAVAGGVVVCLALSGRSGPTSVRMVIIAGPAGGSFITTTSIDRWGCGVTVQPFRPGGPDERLDAASLDLAVVEWYAMTNAQREEESQRAANFVGYPKSWPAASPPRTEEIVPAPIGWPGWRSSGCGLSGTPPAGSITGRWVESAYGWPVACLRVRGFSHGEAFSWAAAGRAQPPVGYSRFALAPRAATFNFALVAGPAFLLGVPGALAVLRVLRRRRVRLGRCDECGYDRGGVPGPCPECGRTPTHA